jgi:hypothetical protein
MNLRQIIDAEQQDKGWGDTVKRVTTAVGIKPCGGCKKRAEAMNKRFPYRQYSTPASMIKD